MNGILGALALLSLALLLWQWLVGRGFPLHQRCSSTPFHPGVTLLKPLKGCDEATEACLRSWLAQQYHGPVQILFAVASADDPVCELVRRLLRESPGVDGQLLVCGPLAGANLKVSKLLETEKLAVHEILVISDADVKAPTDFLVNAVQPLADAGVGLVNSFYCLANPTTLAMRWEALAVNADFWSQVLQSQSLRPLDFALGAVMLIRRRDLKAIGGFAALSDCLADDYQLGNRITKLGRRIAISPVVAECWSAPVNWTQVWKHQLRWARTIRVCQPVPYFFSILSNATLWPVLWLALEPGLLQLVFCVGCLGIRVFAAIHLQNRMTRTSRGLRDGWLALLKDLLQIGLWALAFLGNKIEWRGEKMRLRKDGTLVKV
ncbi:MAG: glycosyltransferase [Limisphaerales bacterium]